MDKKSSADSKTSSPISSISSIRSNRYSVDNPAPRNESSSSDGRSSNSLPADTTATASSNSTQLRSALAIGQLIASNRPTAGSRLVASELRALNKNLQRELSSLKHELSELPNALSHALSTMNTNEATAIFGAPIVRSRRPPRPFVPSMGAHRRLPLLRRPMFRLRARNSINQTTQTNETQEPVSPLSMPSTDTTAPSSMGPVIDVSNADQSSDETSNFDEGRVSVEHSPIATTSNRNAVTAESGRDQSNAPRSSPSSPDLN